MRLTHGLPPSPRMRARGRVDGRQWRLHWFGGDVSSGAGGGGMGLPFNNFNAESVKLSPPILIVFPAGL